MFVTTNVSNYPTRAVPKKKEEPAVVKEYKPYIPPAVEDNTPAGEEDVTLTVEDEEVKSEEDN